MTGSVVEKFEAGAKELKKDVKPIGERAIEYDEMLCGEVASEEEKLKTEAESLERKTGLPNAALPNRPHRPGNGCHDVPSGTSFENKGKNAHAILDAGADVV